MKTFAEFIAEEDEWSYAESTNGRHHTFTHRKTGEELLVRYHTEYGKDAKSRLRNPAKTKWHVMVDGASGSVAAKTVTKAENSDARERKAKAVQSIIKSVKKTHGADLTPAFRYI